MDPKTLNGFFFHFSKALWKKCCDYGLTKKNLEKKVQFWRTYNICESFHRTINNHINHFHPKIAYLSDKLKNYTVDAFKKYNSLMVLLILLIIRCWNIIKINWQKIWCHSYMSNFSWFDVYRRCKIFYLCWKFMR